MVCCVTGHRPKGFPFERSWYEPLYIKYVDMLALEIENLFNEGYNHFVVGMAEGADLDFARAVLNNKGANDNVVLEAVPYPKEVVKRITEQAREYQDILARCDRIHTVSDHYFKGCMQKRNRYMVDKSDIVIAIWNGREEGGTWYTIKYARSKNKPIRYIMI